MNGSSNGQNSGMNPNEKIPSPPPPLQQLQQPSGGVPSIFLGRTNNSMPTAEGSDSSSQTTQTSMWNSCLEVQHEQSCSSSSGGAMADSYKMKSCASTQCGIDYEGPTSSNISTVGCQPPLQNRMYAPYIQQQQIAMPIRSMHQHHHHHHHHHGVPGCHPHHPQQSSMTVGPHLDRMVHGGSSAVAVAAAQQMRSIVMNHYPPNSTGYPHQNSSQSASSYYPQTVATAAGNGPFMEYNPSHQHQHPHHHHHGHGISAAAAAAVQYAHQQQQHHQRMISSAAAATLTPYRQVPVHHHQKVISSSQATVAYQSAYQQHQYNHYLHHHGIVPPHSHPHHQNGSGAGAAGVMQQRMLGIPVTNLQQQQQAYMNRTTHHLPQIHHPQHNSGYSSACQPSLVSNYTGTSQQQQQQLVHPMVGPGVASNNSNPTTTLGLSLDFNNNSTSASKTMGSSSDIPGTKSINNNNKKTSSEVLVVSQKSQHNSSLRISSSIKLSAASPDKSVKLKAARSVTKLRDRQPRLVVGQKKKSTGNIGGSSSSRKLKSLKALSAAVAGADNLHSCNKRLTTSSLVEVEGNGDAKRSRRAFNKTGDTVVVAVVNPNSADVSAVEENSEKKDSADEKVTSSIRQMNVPLLADKCILEEQRGDEYVPTPEEMQKYLERLNTCNNLNIPLYYAYSVFHGKLSKKKLSTEENSASATTSASEGTLSTSTTTTTSTRVFYQHHQQFNFTTYCNWDSSELSAESEWNNFQDDMAVLEAYFPLLNTMEQSERAEKMDAIYTYEGQMKLINSNNAPAVTTCASVRDQISPPCNCVQDTTPCSCCYNYLGSMMPGTPDSCGNVNDHGMACTVGDSPPQFVMDSGFHHHNSQPHFMSTPLSSRRTYTTTTGSHFYDEENGYYLKEGENTRNRVGARKRSSSYPSRKSDRRSSGSRDHLKSETESFLDELISTANDEKLSKQRNSSGEITAPEIQCEVDFPSLASSAAAVPYSKRQTKKGGKVDENLSAREQYFGSSSPGTDESESNTSACSSSPLSTLNSSTSEGDFDGASEITLVDVDRVANHCINSKTSHPILLPSTCSTFEHDAAGTCCSRPEHLWDDFRGDEVISMQPAESFSGSTCVPIDNLLISHCTCRRVDAVCPTRPPPGFEHLSRPAFPIELYDPSLLGSLIGGQLPREVLSSLDSSSLPRKQFEEMEELLISLTCCEKHAVDKMLYSRRSSISLSSDEEELHGDSDDDWDTLEKAIKTVLNDWTEELGFRKRMQDILFTLNLHDVYGGCCKNLMPFEPPENANNCLLDPCSSASSTSSSRPFTMTASPPEEASSIFPQSDDDKS